MGKMAIAWGGGRAARQWWWQSSGAAAWGWGLRNGHREQEMTMATLAYEEVLVPETPSEKMKTIMFVHGLLGSGRNWRTFAKRLGSDALQQSPNSPGYRMVLVDLRNHGRSASLQGFDPPHDIPAAARDVMDLIRAGFWKSPEMIISHSMGGKVTLEIGQIIASGKGGDVVPPKQLWVLDSVPGKVPEQVVTGDVEQVLDAIKDAPHPIPSRRWLVDHITSLGFSKNLADWMASNLKKFGNSRDELIWIFNAEGAEDMFHSYRALDCWPVIESPPKGMQIGFVRASKSDRWSPEMVSKLESLSNSRGSEPSKIFYHVLENAGHWLHVDNPSGLLKILVPYVLKLSK